MSTMSTPHIALVLLLLATVSLSAHARSTATTGSALAGRADAAPKGCKWQRWQPPSTGATDTDATASHQLTGAGLRHQLTCKLRTISGIDALIGNLSAYQHDRIAALRLDCSDVLFFESSLEAGNAGAAFLGALRNLRDLRIEFCKIRRVPAMVLRGLRDLKRMSLRTHNSDWSAINLELHADAFRGLTELRDLDLADNNLWTLPAEVFCPLFSLRQLNLTRNRLTDIGQLGFSEWAGSAEAAGAGKPCNTGVESLDLSRNHLASMPDNALSALRSLRTLQLQDNLLTAIADRAFHGLHSLSVLNMSSNRLIALPQELFQSPRALTQLLLQNNTLAVLAPGLLDGLDRLEVLDLSRNELTSAWVARDTFAGLVRLVVLNLGNNALTTIDASVFRGLYSMQILNLEANAIASIAPNAFADLRNLHALTLSRNRLTTVDHFHLAELHVLQQLFLDGNQLSAVDARAFENLTQLNDLSLNDNQLSAVPRALQQLRSLKSLDLGKNGIRSLGNNSFAGLEQLLGLRLVDNQLTNITRDTFRSLPAVHVLNLASNQIRHIDQSAFAANPTLRAIRLDANQLEDISGVFTALPQLVWLNVSDNRLRWFDYSHLPVSLEWLDAHRNNISELANYFDLGRTLQIKMLDVSHNQLLRLDAASLPDSLETLYANDNALSEVAAGTFAQKTRLEKVVLAGNALRSLDVGSLALAPVADGRAVPAFYLAGNPLHCDCRLEWLQRINELAHLRQHPRVLDLDAIQCSVEHERGELRRQMMDLRTQDFVCRYETHCFALCHCCEYDACDCKMQCPVGCSCYHDHTWSANVVDCGGAGYTEVPERIPMDATAIYLDGNDLGELGDHAFIGKKRLELLYLNGSRIVSVHNRTFNGVPALRVLHLEQNALSELRGDEFGQVPQLSELHVDGNRLAAVGERTFAALPNLEVLSMSDNRLEGFRPWQQLAPAVESGALSVVRLHGMKWRCDCPELRRLQEWLEAINGGEFDVHQMICTDGRIVAEAARQCGGAAATAAAANEVREGAVATATAVHRATGMLGGGQQGGNVGGLIGAGYVPLMAAILVAVIGTALIIALACIFRQDVRLWAHAKYGVRLFKDPTQVLGAGAGGGLGLAGDAAAGEKAYDAYLVYSVRDADFAGQIVAAELAQSGYQLCLHHRDIHAAAYLSEALQAAADAAKKLVLIVSMNFLQAEWSQPQFRLALQSVVEAIPRGQRSHRVVLVLTAPVEYVAADAMLAHLMRTCPVVCWGERRFWDKLRFSLPDISHSRTMKKMGGGGGGTVAEGAVVSRSPNLRYTAAPQAAATATNLAAWCKQHPGMALPVAGQQMPLPLPQSPAHSTGGSHSDEDESSCGGSSASQHYEAPPQMMQPQQMVPQQQPVNYGPCRSTTSASSLGHVYSTIPETPQLDRNGRAYFV